VCRAEQGKKARKSDGGGEGLSLQGVRQRHGLSMCSAGMEDTPGNAAIMGHQERVGLCTFSHG